MEKTCSKCGLTMPLDSFHRDKNKRDGHSGQCKECAKQRSHDWWKRNPERARANARRWDQLNKDKVNQRARERYRSDPNPGLDAKRKYRYGIDADQYQQMITAQHGLCAICKRPPGRNRLNVDHDHVTGQVRELLCGACNQGLGMMRDDPAVLRAALRYLERHKP